MNDELEHQIERVFGANSAGLSWNRATVTALAALIARREREAVQAAMDRLEALVNERPELRASGFPRAFIHAERNGKPWPQPNQPEGSND
jgi:hypothetical protein